MKRVFNLIIVDESGSMEIIRKEAWTGMNETLETIVKLQQLHPDMEQHVTLLTFDTTHQRFIYDNALAAHAKSIAEKDYRPCGGTPLYDAIGIGIAKVNAQTTPEDNVLVTIITDGEENSSCEYNLTLVQNLIEKLKKQGWTFTLIGTDNLDVENMAGTMAIEDHLTFCQNEKETREMFQELNEARIRFNDCLYNKRDINPGSHFKKPKK